MRSPSHATPSLWPSGAAGEVTRRGRFGSAADTECGDGRDLNRAAQGYGKVATLAPELERRPLSACNRLGLGHLPTRSGQPDQARIELAEAQRLPQDLA